MSQLDHRAWEELIFAEFAGGIAASDRAAMREHVLSCDACGRLYERCARAERALSPSLLLERNLSRLVEPSADVARARPGLGLSVAGLLGAALIGLFLLRGGLPPSAPDLAPRGGVHAEKIDPRYSVRVLGSAEGPDGKMTVFDAKERALVPGERLLILATNLGDSRSLDVLAILPSGAREVLVDRVSIGAGAEDLQLVPSIEVSPAWSKGPVRLVAVFSDRPMDPQAMTSDLVVTDQDGISIRSVMFSVGPKEAGR
ncbi:MAG: zf-HC2 domain-containing protein [Myxococcota bacterium]